MVIGKDWNDAKEHAKEAINGFWLIVEKYHYEGRMVAPYGVPITVRELFLGWDDFEGKTYTEQLAIMGEAMIFADVLDKWVEQEYNGAKVW